MSFKRQIVLILLAIGIIPAAIIAVVTTWLSTQAISDAQFEHLSSVRSTKALTVGHYLSGLMDEVEVLAQSPDVENALLELSDAYQHNKLPASDVANQRKALSAFYQNEFLPKWQKNSQRASSQATDQLVDALSDNAIGLQYQYIVSNPNPVGNKDELLESAAKDRYSSLHKSIHPFLREAQQHFGLYDLFLIDKAGNVVYSVFKELDFATSLTSGPYANSGLATSFNKALNLPSGEVSVTDFSLYTPSYDLPAGFISTPVYQDGQSVGVMVAQFPMDRLNEIMGERDGLGETGETYLVGPDKLMRSDSYLDPEYHSIVGSFTHPDKGRVDTEAVRKALSQKAGTEMITDYNGNPVLSAYGPLDFAGLNFG